MDIDVLSALRKATETGGFVWSGPVWRMYKEDLCEKLHLPGGWVMVLTEKGRRLASG